MNPSDTVCRVCGRIQQSTASGDGPLPGEQITTGRMLAWMAVIILVCALAAWIIVRLGG